MNPSLPPPLSRLTLVRRRPASWAGQYCLLGSRVGVLNRFVEVVGDGRQQAALTARFTLYGPIKADRQRDFRTARQKKAAIGDLPA